MTMTTTRRGKSDTSESLAEIRELVREGFKDVATRLAETDKKAERAAQVAQEAVAMVTGKGPKGGTPTPPRGVARGTSDVDDEAAIASIGLGRKRATAGQRKRGRWDVEKTDEMDRLKDDFAVMMSERPCYTAELAEAFGVTVSKATNVIMLLEREGARLYRLGAPQRQVWWIADDESVTFLRAHPRSTWFK